MSLPLALLRRNLGPRVLKSGLAVFLTLAATHALAPEYGVFSGLAAFLAVQPSVVRSRATIQQQVLGNLLGAVLGAAIAMTMGHGPLAMATGVVVVLVVLRWLHLPESINLAVVMLLFLLHRPEGEFLVYGVNRIGAVFFGTLMGYLVNRFVAPPNYRQQVLAEILSAGRGTDALLEEIRRHLVAPAALEKSAIKAAGAAVQTDLDMARHYLRLGEEDGSVRFEALHKAIASIAVFSERLMDVHKVLLQAGPLDPAWLRAIDRVLAAIGSARQAVYARLTAPPGRTRRENAAAGLAEGQAAAEAVREMAGALEDLDRLVNQLVTSPEQRSSGLALHTVLISTRHMAYRLESLQRFLDNHGPAAANQARR